MLEATSEGVRKYPLRGRYASALSVRPLSRTSSLDGRLRAWYLSEAIISFRRLQCERSPDFLLAFGSAPCPASALTGVTDTQEIRGER